MSVFTHWQHKEGSGDASRCALGTKTAQWLSEMQYRPIALQWQLYGFYTTSIRLFHPTSRDFRRTTPSIDPTRLFTPF